MKHRSSWWKTLIGIILTLIMLFPVYWMINISFTQRRSIRSGDLFPKDFTLDNYASALSSQLPYLGTSLLVAIGCVILTLAIALPSSYAIVFLEFKGSKSMNFLLIVAQMIPAVVMSLGFYQIYNDIGLLDSIPGLIVADSTLSVPFAVILMTGFMSGMPRSLVEAAQIDGASQWGVFAKIVIPLSRNTIVTTSLFAFLWAWSDFMFASTLDSGGGKMRPITMGLYDFIGSQNQEWGPMMATAVLASVPTALLLIFAQKYVARKIHRRFQGAQTLFCHILLMRKIVFIFRGLVTANIFASNHGERIQSASAPRKCMRYRNKTELCYHKTTRPQAATTMASPLTSPVEPPNYAMAIL